MGLHHLNCPKLKDIQKIGNIHNFSSGKEIITANIKTSYKIFRVLGFDLNTFENQTCKLFYVYSDSIYFLKKIIWVILFYLKA